MRKAKYLVHPYRLYENLRWLYIKKKLQYCGTGTFVKWNFIISVPKYISIGSDVHIGHGCELRTYPIYNGNKTGYVPNLIINDNVVIADNCYVSCINKIVIGNGTLLGTNVFITDNFHGNSTLDELVIPPDRRILTSKGPVIIGKNVWIGRNVCILPGVSVGDGAVIGANAVVTTSIPEKCIVAGVPAKIIKAIE